MESGIPENFECGIWNTGLWNPEYYWRNQNPTKDCNPESKLKDNYWNEVLVIRNPRRGIQNLWMSLIPLQAAKRWKTILTDNSSFSVLFFFPWNSPAETLALPLLFTPRQPPLCYGRVQKLTGLTLQSPKWNFNSDEKQFSITILRSQSNSPAETLTWPLLF